MTLRIDFYLKYWATVQVVFTFVGKTFYFYS